MVVLGGMLESLGVRRERQWHQKEHRLAGEWKAPRQQHQKECLRAWTLDEVGSGHQKVRRLAVCLMTEKANSVRVSDLK